MTTRVRLGTGYPSRVTSAKPFESIFTLTTWLVFVPLKRHLPVLRDDAMPGATLDAGHT